MWQYKLFEIYLMQKKNQIGAVDTVRTTTTVTVHKKGPITATSIIESIPNSNNQAENDLAPSSVSYQNTVERFF